MKIKETIYNTFIELIAFVLGGVLPIVLVVLVLIVIPILIYINLNNNFGFGIAVLGTLLYYTLNMLIKKK